MTDIVERLRDLARVDNCQASLEAADEIERLRAALREIAAMDEVSIVEWKKGDGWLHQRVASAALGGRDE